MPQILDPEMLNALLELGEGDDDPRAFLNEMIDTFVSATPEVLKSLEEAVEAEDNKKAAHYAHKLKGLATNLGVMAVTKPCDIIEGNGMEGKLTKANLTEVTTLQETFKQAVKELDENWRK